MQTGTITMADMTRHLVSLSDHDRAWVEHVMSVSFDLRTQREAGQANAKILDRQTLLMIFEKPSLRTRISFEQAMFELGGRTIVQTGAEVGIGDRESPADVARVVEGMVHGICARVFAHEKLTRLAAHSHIPVINALSDDSHPCQALADLMTIHDEFGRDVADIEGKTVAFIGDGNNVARSIAILCGIMGMHFKLAAPAGYAFNRDEVDAIMGQYPQMDFAICHDPAEAVHFADVIYTDTWVSMGQEEEKQRRLNSFSDYQINDKLLKQAPEHAIVLHCLPAYRGVEITDDIMDGPRSRVFQQAHNRLHAQKGLLAVLMGGK